MSPWQLVTIGNPGVLDTSSLRLCATVVKTSLCGTQDISYISLQIDKFPARSWLLYKGKQCHCILDGCIFSIQFTEAEAKPAQVPLYVLYCIFRAKPFTFPRVSVHMMRNHLRTLCSSQVFLTKLQSRCNGILKQES